MTPPANQLARIDTSKKALAKITSVRDVKKYVSAMTAVQKVRKDAGAELAEINEHVEKRIRLMRRGGQLLHELGVAPGNPHFSHDERIGPKLTELGVCRTLLACFFRADRLPCRHVHSICECRP